MLNVLLSEFMILFSGILLVFLLLADNLYWTWLFPWMQNCHGDHSFSYGYSERDGPHTWKSMYAACNGRNQSPINITTRLAIVVQPSEPLRWIGYNKRPASMTITNTGFSVIVNTLWRTSVCPYIEGGPLTNTYNLWSMKFHWGPTNEEGSEHTIDYVRYPMELQVFHLSRNFESPMEAIKAEAHDSMMIVSFFFQITNADNPYLDNIVTNLWRIQRPGCSVHVAPFPLEWFFEPFEKNYYTYNGSLTQPPCSEIVTWILCPEPIAISRFQVAQFRTLSSSKGPILSNCRPVQQVNDRSVYFYE
nr:carbonic anhydrase 1-like [Megalopta genalis]